MNARRAITPMLATALALLAPSAAGAAQAASAPSTHTPDRAGRIRQLVHEIARADEVVAAAAAEALIDELVGPLADAIGAMGSRPASEQLRLRAALSSVSAAVRVKLFRAGLEGEDAALADAFAERYPELVRALFDDDARVRIDAIRQVPFAPDTGAGVFIAAKVDDFDADVAEAALLAAARLGDRVVARNLARFVRDATEALRSGLYGPGQRDVGLVLTKFCGDCIEIIGRAGYREAAGDVLDALRYHSTGPYRDYFQAVRALAALARLADPSAIPAIEPFLDDPSPVRTMPLPGGGGVSQRAGDVALLSIAAILGWKPEEFGMRSVSVGDVQFYGFTDDDARRRGVRELRIRLSGQAAASSPASQGAPE